MRFTTAILESRSRPSSLVSSFASTPRRTAERAARIWGSARIFDDGLQMAPLFRARGEPFDQQHWQLLPPPPIETILAICGLHGVEIVGPLPA
jgi:hypothetical protein